LASLSRTLLRTSSTLTLSAPASTADADIVANAGKADSPTSLTVEEAKALLPELGKIHPDLAEPRELTDARSPCGDIQDGKDAATITDNAAKRFGNGSTRVLTAAQAEQVVAAIRANGFCQAA
jgi:hypothetical protein